MEIRKGTIITPAKLRSIFTPIFQFVNEIDPTTVKLTTGQFVAKNSGGTIMADLLTIYSDQYFKTDIMLEQYAGDDVSYFQKYIDKLAEIEGGIT